MAKRYLITIAHVDTLLRVLVSGHIDQLFHPQGWDFHLKTVAAFGTAVRLRGFLGVRLFSRCVWRRTDEGIRKTFCI
jgi:hypothetical protein